MFFDWIAREGGALLSWWLLALLAGIAVFPLIYRLMGALPSRGYALARAAGLLLIGFLFWLFGNLGLLWNTPGSVILVAVVVCGVGVVSYARWTDREQEPLLPWLRKNVALITTTEILFLVLFVGWAAVRALNPDMSTTEHPMDIAFLSAIRRSANFPPHDPWMSGYAISYYYFGYFLIAMIANLTSVTNGMAFSLGIALVFAMAGTGAFGLTYDLVTSRQRRRKRALRPWPGLSVGILACVMFVLMGNLGTAFVEMPYQAKAISPGYLSWLDLRYRPPDMSGCEPSGSADPATWGCGWWWWAYSRVVKDYNLSGADIGDVITEFPNFSFILSDLHPHVTALPFAVVTLGLALNLVLRKRRLMLWELALYAVYFGAMTFLNSWDALYIGIFVGAEALRRLIHKDGGSFVREDWLGIAGMSAGLVGLIGLFYLPFFLSFHSQVQGILPDVIWPTQFAQFFLMFGPFIVILGVFLLVEVLRAGRSFNAVGALKILGWALAVGILAMIILGVFSWINQNNRSIVYRIMDESGGLLTLIPAILTRRVQGLVTEGLLLLAIFVVIGRLFVRKPPAEEESEGEPGKPENPRKNITYSPTTGFVLLLIGAGAVLTLACDFVYLHDGFGYRINMIFKLYYQSWVMWSIASAFALWSVFAEPIPSRVQLIIRPALSFAAVILIIAGLMFPVAAITTRGFKDGGHLTGAAGSNPMTLDGSMTLASGPDDYAVIQCLSRVAVSDSDVVAEATKNGVAYNPTYGRVSALTGIPTLLGWDNHERQWRGPTFDQVNVISINNGQQTETRQDAIGKLYNTTNWKDAQAIIERYGITYIYVGPTERRDFEPAGIAKFDSLKPVCSSGNVAAYSVASVGNLTTAGNG